MDPPELEIGTIVGIQGSCVVVRTPDGSEILCGGAAALHRRAGCFSIRAGVRVKLTTPVENSARRRRVIEIVRND